VTRLFRFLSIPVLALATVASAADEAPFALADGDTVWLTDPVIVVGSRVPAALPLLLRPVAAADPTAAAPVRSPAELLATLPSVEVSQRQQYGVQADLSIRGATFEQVQVLLDGWDVGDPQTGHHNLDLPLDLADMERLEVLRGHGSALYGANAFGGVVNVVPRAPSPTRGGALTLGGGDAGTHFARARLESGDVELTGLSGRAWLSGGRFRTDGDRPGTDADTWTVSGRAVGRTGWGELDLLAGYADRAFGALDFYAPFPSHEHTQSLFAGLRLRADLSERVVLEQRLGGRRHRDRFTLVRDDPDRYRNDHATRRAAVETRLLVDAGHGLALAAGIEGVYEDIRSDGIRGGAAGPALGDHERRRASASLEIAGRRRVLHWSLGARLDAWSGLVPTLSRSAAASLDLGDGVLLRASSGTVYRVPTFTELHYEDPANQGDPGLLSEHGWSWDLGGEVRRGPWTLVWEYFARHERDLIDWVRPAAADAEPWRVMNIAGGEVRGWSQTCRVETPRGDSAYLNHAYLDRERDLPGDLAAKYDFLAPRHLVSAGVAAGVGRSLRFTAQARYREHSDGRGHLVADAGASRSWAACRLDLAVTNLIDREYEEIPGVPLPGRRITLSTRLAF